jgi:MYXO-CTERM domain-containing protein
VRQRQRVARCGRRRLGSRIEQRDRSRRRRVVPAGEDGDDAPAIVLDGSTGVLPGRLALIAMATSSADGTGWHVKSSHFWRIRAGSNRAMGSAMKFTPVAVPSTGPSSRTSLASPSIVSSLAALLGAALVTFAPVTARADTTCSHDSDCVKGFICQTNTVNACPDIACAPGEECNLPPCMSTTTSVCVPGPCSADSDCASGMVCFEQAVNCTTPAEPPCPSGGDCPVVDVDAGATCSGSTKSCVPRYVPPCTADADCGAGFSCVADQACGCSGSAGNGGGGTVVGPKTPTNAPDEPAPAVDGGSTTPPDCSCTDLGTNHCQAKTINCGTVSDCPAQWSCEQPPSVSSGCAVGVSADGSPIATDCTPIQLPPVQSVCEPPYYDLGFSGGSGEGLSAAAPTTGTDNAGSGSASKGATPSASGASGSDSSDQGGCSMSSSPSDARGAGVWAALIGLAAFTRRRRASRA